LGEKERERRHEIQELARRNSRIGEELLPAPAQVNASGNKLLPESPLHDGSDGKSIETGRLICTYNAHYAVLMTNRGR